MNNKSTCQQSLWTKFMDEFLVKPDSTLNCFNLHLYFQTFNSLERFIHMHRMYSWESHAHKHIITHILFPVTCPSRYLCFDFKAILPNILGKVTVKICWSRCGLGLAHNHNFPYSQNCSSIYLQHTQISLSAWTVKQSVLPDMPSFSLGPQDIIIDEFIRKSVTLQGGENEIWLARIFIFSSFLSIPDVGLAGMELTLLMAAHAFVIT